MNRIGITQRVERVESYAESRDCLDQRWWELLWQLGAVPVPLPNLPADRVDAALDRLDLQAVILSGGNDLCAIAADSPSASPLRDEFETGLVRRCLQLELPMLGVCRGMQMLNLYFGGSLAPVEGHIAVEHTIRARSDRYELPASVNSYHGWGVPPDQLAEDLEPLATDLDGNIEAFTHRQKKILGIMWHPERAAKPQPLDIQLMKQFLP